MFEVVNPLLLHRFEYLTDSAGAGRWRGGLGVETILTFEDGPVQASIFGDGGTPDMAAFGILGGGDGCVNEVELGFPDGSVVRPRLKDLVTGIPAGTTYRQVAGGGGGYGDPRQRPAGRVLEETRNGVVSLDSARRDYGVVIDPVTWTVDDAATAALRQG
jgi:N-methylhydantoinase B